MEKANNIFISNDFDIEKYKGLNIEDLQYHLLTSINWLPIEDNLKNKVMENIYSISNSPNQQKLNDLTNACIVIDIMNNIVFKHASEVLKGAHIMVSDDGMLYDKLLEAGIIKTRLSSHHKNNKKDKDASFQAGEIFREFLVGKTKDGKTWFQLEAHSTGGLANLIAHMFDYIMYKITGKNVGQYGLSGNLDNNPIHIDFHKELKSIKETLESSLKCNKNYKIQESIDEFYTKLITKNKIHSKL